MPPPAPVIDHEAGLGHLAPELDRLLVLRAGRQSARGTEHGDLPDAAIGGEEPEGVAQLAKRGLNHAHVPAVLYVREQLQRVLDNIGDILRV